MQSLIITTPSGLYCPLGDFYIDPRKPVTKAIITHAHGDHARTGSLHYLAAAPSRAILQRRLGASASIETLHYGQTVTLNGVRVSLYPAGHILGSAQVRIEYKGEVWVVSGDYKLAPDPTCLAIEPIVCNTFITESTFGLPIYRWPDNETVFQQIYRWWRYNAEQGKASILLAYSLGKAQRILAGLKDRIAHFYTHTSVEQLTEAYRQTGIALPQTIPVADTDKKTSWSQGLILAPPAILNTTWAKQFGAASIGFASGWMLVRGARSRKGVDKGFVFSDHADWPGLLNAIQATNAERILVMHGATETLARYLREQGLQAAPLA